MASRFTEQVWDITEKEIRENSTVNHRSINTVSWLKTPDKYEKKLRSVWICLDDEEKVTKYLYCTKCLQYLDWYFRNENEKQRMKTLTSMNNHPCSNLKHNNKITNAMISNLKDPERAQAKKFICDQLYKHPNLPISSCTQICNEAMTFGQKLALSRAGNNGKKLLFNVERHSVTDQVQIDGRAIKSKETEFFKKNYKFCNLIVDHSTRASYNYAGVAYTFCDDELNRVTRGLRMEVASEDKSACGVLDDIGDLLPENPEIDIYFTADNCASMNLIDELIIDSNTRLNKIFCGLHLSGSLEDDLAKHEYFSVVDSQLDEIDSYINRRTSKEIRSLPRKPQGSKSKTRHLKGTIMQYEIAAANYTNYLTMSMSDEHPHFPDLPSMQDIRKRLDFRKTIGDVMFIFESDDSNMSHPFVAYLKLYKITMQTKKFGDEICDYFKTKIDARFLEHVEGDMSVLFYFLTRGDMEAMINTSLLKKDDKKEVKKKVKDDFKNIITNWRKNAEKALQNYAVHFVDDDDFREEPEPPEKRDKSEDMDPLAILQKQLEGQLDVNNNEPIDDVGKHIKAEINLFKKWDKKVGGGVKFWNDSEVREKLPTLRRVYRSLLCIVFSNAAVERLFSRLTLIISDKRFRLDPATVEALGLMHYNHKREKLL